MSTWELLRGDALAILKGLPNDHVDAIVTDPPYSSGGVFRSDRMTSTRTKYVDGRDQTYHPDFAGDNRDQRGYAYWCSLWLAECLRIVKPGGVVCLFTDWRQLPTTTDILQAGGWVWRGICPWDKTEAARPMKGRFRSQCEYVVWGSRGPMPNEGPCLPGLWRQSVLSEDKHHIAGKPPSVLAGVVAICPGGGGARPLLRIRLDGCGLPSDWQGLHRDRDRRGLSRGGQEAPRGVRGCPHGS